jgi:hypothetical protein
MFQICDFLSISTGTTETMILSAKDDHLVEIPKDSWHSDEPFASSAISECHPQLADGEAEAAWIAS